MQKNAHMPVTSTLLLSKGVASVGVGSIDREHEECVRALNALVQGRSLQALQQVCTVTAAHFHHEEEVIIII